MAAAVSREVATSVPSEVAMLVPATHTEDSATATGIATPAVGSKFVSLPNAEGSPRVRARPLATSTSAGADTLAHGNALLAWLSSSRFPGLQPTEEISSGRQSNAVVTPADSSELNSVDEIVAGLERTLRFYVQRA